VLASVCVGIVMAHFAGRWVVFVESSAVAAGFPGLLRCVLHVLVGCLKVRDLFCVAASDTDMEEWGALNAERKLMA
jgi:hypothetical protein